MHKFEKDAATRYWDCGSTHLSIYPVVVEYSENPEATKIQLKAARRAGTSWVQMPQIIDGVDYNTPINSWQEALQFAKDEIKRLRQKIANCYLSEKNSNMVGSPRNTPEHWEPILIAWEYFATELEQDIKNEILKEI